MAKYILYMLLGLFLLSKFASVSNDLEACKMAHIISMQCVDTQHSFSEANPSLYQNVLSDEHSAGKVINAHAIHFASLRGISFSIVLKLIPTSVFANFMKPLKSLHSEEKTIPLSFNINPYKFSCGYYVYLLRRILI